MATATVTPAHRATPRRRLARALAAALLACGVATVTPAPALAAVGPAADTASHAHQLRGACDANDNLGEVANNFISRCRKASIRQVFPGQHYGDKLGDIKSCGTASCKTAWKLLNDNRFKK
jgi:hypothetical protein